MPIARVIDISSWQHPAAQPVIDWRAVAGSGISGVMVKATQGVNYVNPFLKGTGGVQNDYADAKAAGLLVGVYHFAQPSRNAADAEARYFLENISGLAVDLGAALDFEELGAVPFHEAGQWAQDFLSVIRSAGYTDPFYTDQSILNSLVGAPWSSPLWIADPSNTYTGTPWMRQTGTATVPGIAGQVDGDNELYSIRGVNPAPGGGGTPTPPPPEPAPEPAPPPPPPQPQPPEVIDVNVPVLSEANPGPATKSAPVANLQALLTRHGFDVGPTGPDGYFGAHTAAAVRAAETAWGLTVDAGIAGNEVWGALCTR